MTDSRRLLPFLPLAIVMLILGTRHADSTVEQVARILTLAGFALVVAGIAVHLWRSRAARND